MKSGILDKIFEALYKKSKHGREMEDTNKWLSEIHKPATTGSMMWQTLIQLL